MPLDHHCKIEPDLASQHADKAENDAGKHGRTASGAQRAEIHLTDADQHHAFREVAAIRVSGARERDGTDVAGRCRNTGCAPPGSLAVRRFFRLARHHYSVSIPHERHHDMYVTFAIPSLQSLAGQG